MSLRLKLSCTKNYKNVKLLQIRYLFVDGIQVVYQTVNFINPEQFTVAVSKYDDPYFALRFIEYFKLLAKDANMPEILLQRRTKSLNDKS